MKKLLIVDGNSILNRAFYGVRPLTTRDGRNTNAIFGFINMLHKQITELSPDFAAIAFQNSPSNLNRPKTLLVLWDSIY